MSILFFKHFVIRKKKERYIVILIILFFFRKAGQQPGLRAKEETVYEKNTKTHFWFNDFDNKFYLSF